MGRLTLIPCFQWLISWVGILFCALVSFSVSGTSSCLHRKRSPDFDSCIFLGTRRLFDRSLECAGNFRLFQDDCSSGYYALHGHVRRTFPEQGYRARKMFPNGRFYSLQAAPLLLAPLSEVYGRSYIYFVSAVVFFLCFLPQALAKSIVLVLVFRFISGIAGSTAVSLVGGTLADVWRDEDRGTPMALFSFAAFGCTSPRFSRTFREQRLTFCGSLHSDRTRSRRVWIPRRVQGLPLCQLGSLRHERRVRRLHAFRPR